MRRINDAVVYFRKWPSLKSQKDAIRGLEELSTMAAKECIDEFNRLMRTVGPAVQFQASILIVFHTKHLEFRFLRWLVSLWPYIGSIARSLSTSGELPKATSGRFTKSSRTGRHDHEAAPIQWHTILGPSADKLFSAVPRRCIDSPNLEP